MLPVARFRQNSARTRPMACAIALQSRTCNAHTPSATTLVHTRDFAQKAPFRVSFPVITPPPRQTCRLHAAARLLTSKHTRLHQQTCARTLATACGSPQNMHVHPVTQPVKMTEKYLADHFRHFRDHQQTSRAMAQQGASRNRGVFTQNSPPDAKNHPKTACIQAPPTHQNRYNFAPTDASTAQQAPETVSCDAATRCNRGMSRLFTLKNFFCCSMPRPHWGKYTCRPTKKLISPQPLRGFRAATP